jgi:arsenate reductase-like glutaredoxin family protein
LKILEEQGVTAEVADYLKTKIENFPEFLEKVYDDFETMYLKEFKSFEQEFKDENFDDEDEKK